jgi:hypothetical protein
LPSAVARACLISALVLAQKVAARVLLSIISNPIKPTIIGLMRIIVSSSQIASKKFIAHSTKSN